MTRDGGIRAFIAFEIPGSVRQIIGREQRAIKAELPGARWARPEGQHLTLQFLGATTDDRLARLSSEVAPRVAGLAAVTVGLSGAGFFPSTQRPRVAWIGGEAIGGAAVAEAVRDASAGAGFDPDRRPWTLHLTQARLDRPWPRAAVEAFLEWGRGLEIEPFACREVVLFRSELRPGGAVYTPLERFPLA
jgi:2'-5' RNA ligase